LVVPSDWVGLDQVPLAGSQVPASWHWSTAVQTIGFEPMQVPPRQASLWVQRLPSSHGVRSASVVWVQPVAGSQLSAVRLLPSLQLGGGPPTQPPPGQVSGAGRALRASPGAGWFVCRQPRKGSQESSVHGLPSLQGGFGTITQPTPGWHESVVQRLWSSQTRGVPSTPTQAPTAPTPETSTSASVAEPVPLSVTAVSSPGWPSGTKSWGRSKGAISKRTRSSVSAFSKAAPTSFPSSPS